MNRTVAPAAALLIVAMATTASAQDKDLIPDELESKAEDRSGWFPRLTVGATIAFAHADNVVGSQNGQTWNLGVALDGGVGYFDPEHEWRNTLTIRHVQTRTPGIDRFVKTTDTFLFESIYLYHIPAVPWIGPFVKFRLDTSLFPGEDVRETTKTYAVTEIDGTVNERTGTSIDTTDAFAPLKLEESVGLFAQPVASKLVTLEFRAGIGARQVFVQNGLAINDDEATPDIIEVERLEDFHQAGGEFFGGISGIAIFDDLGPERPLTYGASAEFLIPFYSSIDEGESLVDLTVMTFQANLGIKLFSWMSLDYALRVVKEPLIVDDFQIQNNLLLNFQYAIL